MSPLIITTLAFTLLAGGALCCETSEIDECAVHLYHVFHHPEDFPKSADSLKTRCDDGAVGVACLQGMIEKCPKYEKGIKYFIENTKQAAAEYCTSVTDPKNEPILSFGRCINVDTTKKYDCCDLLTSHATAAKTLDTTEKKKQGICCGFLKMESCMKEQVADTCKDDTALKAGRKFFEAFTSPVTKKCEHYGLDEGKCDALFHGVTIEPPKTKSPMSTIIEVFTEG